MFRLDSAHHRLFNRLTKSYPCLVAPYSHRITKAGRKLVGLSISHKGEPLVSAATAQNQMQLGGETLEQAKKMLKDHPGGRFAMVNTGPGQGFHVPFLYLKSPLGDGNSDEIPQPAAVGRIPILPEITRADVLDAIKVFANASVPHKFRDSEKYDLVHDAGRYPPIAILGIAAKRVTGRVLDPEDFSGDEDSACFSRLRDLGFVIAVKPNLGPGDGAEWSDVEIDAAVSAYLKMLRAELDGRAFSKAEENRKLRATVLTTRSSGSVEYRMQNISSVLHGLNRRWIAGYKPAANVGSEVTRKIVASLERLDALTREDSLPDADQDAFERKVRHNRLVPPTKKPEGSRKPKKVTRSTEQFERDPQVKAWVLQNAKGKCQLCASGAPFLDDDGLPFLEVHHVIPLADDGEDVVTNAVALCPNCHRRCHHDPNRNAIAASLTKVAQKQAS